LRALRDWYQVPASATGPGAAPGHPSLDRDSRFLLVPPGQESWPAALNAAGRLLQDFRQIRPPDHPAVSAHLEYRHTNGGGGTPLREAPERVAFGLPLPFGSRKLPSTVRAVFQGETHVRSASRIWLRIVRIGNEYVPLVARLSGPLLPAGERIIDPQYRDEHGALANRWDPPADALLDEFCDWVVKRRGAKLLGGV